MGAGFCGRCGRPIPPFAAFCPACGRPTAPIAYRPPAFAGPLHPDYDPTSSRARWGIIGVVILIAAGIALAGLLVIPFPHSFSRTMSGTVFTPGRATIDPPRGSAVSATYTGTGSSTGFVFSVLDAYGQTVYYNGANAGSFHFVAALPPYEFTCVGNVSISGTISYPLI